MTTPKIIIFSDLDGSLLDPKTYSFEPAQSSLTILKSKRIPLILSSSKTRAEIERYQKWLDNHHPFISENGGGIFIPRNYFSFSFPYDQMRGRYLVIELGQFYPYIVKILAGIRNETGLKIKGFSEMSEKELVSICGFSEEEARLAKKREYDEPFLMEGREKEIRIIKKKIEEKGMIYCWGGKFHHLSGKNDKGKAVKILKALYKKQFLNITSIGIGDSPNDLPMLLEVDYPIFLKGERSFLPEDLSFKRNLKVIQGTGPEAWKLALLDVIRDHHL